jgi:hypothetical protein
METGKMRQLNRGVVAAFSSFLIVVLATNVSATLIPGTVDFETDENGAALLNGQKIDAAEFSNPIAITSPDTGVSHLGPTIFDSTPAGPNAAGGDPDLLVNLGNVLILQNTAFPADSGGSDFFVTPDDEADFSPTGSGTVRFDFAYGIEPVSIDLIDINGGVLVDLVLTDGSANTRTYNVPSMWTHDVSVSPLGWHTLDLTILTPQLGEGSSSATGFDTGPYDPTDVVRVDVKYHGSSPSAALDNLVLLPEPSCLVLLATGLLAAVPRRRR